MRWAATALLLIACDVDLERMIDQPRYDSFERCEACPDGTIMMHPPPGTVPRQATLGPPELVRGVGDGGWLREIPIPVDRELLRQGRRRFEIICATCHGPLGDGRSIVAADMALRPPPSLVEPPVSEYPPGRIFLVIEVGWGLMPPYAESLEPAERWAVIAYLEALQSRRVRLDELPSELRRRAERSLP